MIALLAGGDYLVCDHFPCFHVSFCAYPHILANQPGLKGCGQSTTSALALAGFSQRLVAGTGDNHSAEQVTIFLAAWHDDLVTELHENVSGFLKQWQPKLANSIPADFPDLKIL